MGMASGRVCYFDNPRGTSFTRGTAVPIGSFVGGNDLEANNQGQCSDCHAGENPFILNDNRQTDTMMPLLAAQSFRAMREEVLWPSSWPVHIIPAGWGETPGPLTLPPAPTAQASCSTCHYRTFPGGRLPIVAMNRTPGYCQTVLYGSLGRFTYIPGTMPPTGSEGNYNAHIGLLDTLCAAPYVGGQVVQGSVPPNAPDRLSPPMIVEPFYKCGNAIGVEGARFGATVTLRRNGSVVATAVSRGTRVEFPLSVLGGFLPMGGTWEAIQSVGGFNSPPSPTATARNISDDYPGGLPPPVINPSVLYAGARGVGVQHVAGATLEIRRTRAGIPPRQSCVGRLVVPLRLCAGRCIFCGSRLRGSASSMRRLHKPGQ